MPLFYELVHDVVSDEEKSRRVWQKLCKVITRGARSALTAAFLPDNPVSVLAVLKECRRVRGEAHRLLQFVRFQKASDGTYFAMIEPIFDVLPFAVRHFADRFSDQPFIIYDRLRDYGYHYDGSELHRLTIDSDSYHMQTGLLSEDMMDEHERLFQELWRTYVKSTAIMERLNPRKQRQDMPVRYWKYLTEMQK